MSRSLQIFFFFFLTTQIGFAQWFQQNSGTEYDITDIAFYDQNNGIASGWNWDGFLHLTGLVLTTTDGGEHWLKQEGYNGLHDVSYGDSNNCFVVGTQTVLKTTNGGITWTELTINNATLTGVHFTDALNGVAVGYGHDSLPNPQAVILRTIDGGTSWSNQLSPRNSYLYDVYFADNNNGWIVGEILDWVVRGGVILNTTDGGTTWSEQWYSPTVGLTDIYFRDLDNGWAVAYSGQPPGPYGGRILKTTNGGTTWTEQIIAPDRELWGLTFSDDNNGWIVGSDGLILSTIDGGTNWIQQISGTLNWISGVNFTDIDNGWAVGGDGTILHTTNGGVVPVELNSFAATANGKEVTLSWSTATELNNQGFEIQRKFGSNDFVTVGSVKGHGTTTAPNNYTYIDKLASAGKYFYRLKQIDFGGKYEYSQTVEINWSPFTTYKLEQNFPNPFNPATTIGFGIMEKGNVRLSVLNILGEEIKVLLNEQKEAGYHSIDFNASDLPSGVYFYRLQVYPAKGGTGSFIDTKKMILLR